jgi:hypothetical protein
MLIRKTGTRHRAPAQRCREDHDYPSLGPIEEVEIDDREAGHRERSGLHSHNSSTLDGIDQEEKGQRRTLCRHVATTLLEATVVEFSDLRQVLLLPFVKVVKRVHAFLKNRQRLWIIRNT